MNGSDELLGKITNLLIASVEDRKLMMTSMQSMLEASEKRIMASNEKVSELIGICDKLSGCYNEHIRELVKSKDRLADENNRLLSLLAEAIEENRKSNYRVDKMLALFTQISNTSMNLSYEEQY